MVESARDEADGVIRYVLSANRSLSGREAFWVLAVAGLMVIGIGAGFAVAGLWLVLPFSGLEWLLLIYAFRASLDGGRTREVLTIGASQVVLERGREAPETVYRFQRAWLTLEWIQPRFRGYPGRLAFRSHGRQVDVGGFLPEEERMTLFRELQQILRS